MASSLCHSLVLKYMMEQQMQCCYSKFGGSDSVSTRFNSLLMAQMTPLGARGGIFPQQMTSLVTRQGIFSQQITSFVTKQGIFPQQITSFAKRQGILPRQITSFVTKQGISLL